MSATSTRCVTVCVLFHTLSPTLTAGETELHGQLDVTKVDLHPSEQYKSVCELAK